MNIGTYRLDESAMIRSMRRHGYTHNEQVLRYVPRQPRFSWRGTPERNRWRMQLRYDRLSVGQPEKRDTVGRMAGRYWWNRRYFPTGSGPGLSAFAAYRRSKIFLAGPKGFLP